MLVANSVFTLGILRTRAQNELNICIRHQHHISEPTYFDKYSVFARFPSMQLAATLKERRAASMGSMETELLIVPPIGCDPSKGTRSQRCERLTESRAPDRARSGETLPNHSPIPVSTIRRDELRRLS